MIFWYLVWVFGRSVKKFRLLFLIEIHLKSFFSVLQQIAIMKNKLWLNTIVRYFIVTIVTNNLNWAATGKFRFLLLLGNSVYKEPCVLKVKWNLIFEHLLRLFELATLLNMENAIFLLIRPKYNSMQIQ